MMGSLIKRFFEIVIIFFYNSLLALYQNMCLIKKLCKQTERKRSDRSVSDEEAQGSLSGKCWPLVKGATKHRFWCGVSLFENYNILNNIFGQRSEIR